MKWINNKDIEEALRKEKRQYLVGRLERPQEMIDTIEGDIEVGITSYSIFTAENPHVHPICTDYTYVLAGCVKVKLIDGSNKMFTFTKGDFFMIPAGVPHVTKNAPGTKLLFIKSPGTNDKTLIEIDVETSEWLKQW